MTKLGKGVGKGHGSNTVELPPIIARVDIPIPPSMEKNSLAFQMGRCLIFASVSSQGWHLSISHPERYPTWDEVAKVRYELLPKDKWFAMMLPPEEDYIDIHSFCFQLWQVDVPNQGLITLSGS